MVSGGSTCVAPAAALCARRPNVSTARVIFGSTMSCLGSSLVTLNCSSMRHLRRATAAIFIGLPLDAREEWSPAGSTAVEVLERLLEAGGEKYWVNRPGIDGGSQLPKDESHVSTEEVSRRASRSLSSAGR